METTRAPSVPDRPTGVAPIVTVVTSTACHLCDDALRVLREVERNGAVTLSVKSADSAAGQALVTRHRPGLFPLVLLDGRFLSAGRLSRGKLDEALGGVRRPGRGGR